jgi:hypothetical protein
MTDIFDTYPSHAAAREHSAALRAAGVPARRIQVLAAARPRDARLISHLRLPFRSRASGGPSAT